MAHVDKYGQIVSSDSTSKVRVMIQYSNIDKRSVYAPIIEGSPQFTTVGGVATIANLIFAGSPGYNYSLIVTSDGIDTSKRENQDYMA